MGLQEKKTDLDAPALVVNIMITGIIPENVLQGIEREGVSAVIIDRLHGRKCEEKHATAHFQAGHLESNAGTERVHQKTLEWMVVERTKRVRHIEAVVS